MVVTNWFTGSNPVWRVSEGGEQDYLIHHLLLYIMYDKV